MPAASGGICRDLQKAPRLHVMDGGARRPLHESLISDPPRRPIPIHAPLTFTFSSSLPLPVPTASGPHCMA
ncbi:hypothetical protein MPTK1_7g08610 [Marchantia polymorpha subsp. ruderalis]|uniref:Uncharacterized protein n=2 Tax=Marchantia polymorpha TaxID=3197 RepID=A0AAF6BXH0_MARPO|nr:hypothetical protein MARPO_0068s0015 [Marchantia polymorpha]BBN16704.1 hypothetical protein Mp_7g08610 [Marchantia polymorpha subsp. ruderalis]|eukprot:PTQ35787.1 hypothetical protein MARPO_0068s0015 [Marchantia polymorpha]